MRQGKKEQHGELWGLVNLFKDNLECLETHQIIGEQRAPDEFRIEPVDFSRVERAPALAPTSFAGVRCFVTTLGSTLNPNIMCFLAGVRSFVTKPKEDDQFCWCEELCHEPMGFKP